MEFTELINNLKMEWKITFKKNFGCKLLNHIQHMGKKCDKMCKNSIEIAHQVELSMERYDFLAPFFSLSFRLLFQWQSGDRQLLNLIIKMNYKFFFSFFFLS